MQPTFFKKLFTVILVLTVVAFIGCENKTEQKQDEVKNETTMSDTSSSVAEPKDGQPMTQQPVVIPDLKGTWTGTFDQRTTTLTVTEQTDSSFSGRISIKYKEMLNQEVNGHFSPTTKKVYMEDQIHSKFMGKYNGRLSEDGKSLSGTFTMNRDGSKTSFNLNKN